MTFAKQDLSHEFTGNYDLAIQREMHLELWQRDVPFVRWRRLIRDPRLIHDGEFGLDNQTIRFDMFDSTDYLYHEQAPPKYHVPIIARVFIKRQGDEKTLTKLGVVDGRPAIAKFSIPHLETLGIAARQVRIGDLIEYNGHEYEIDSVVEDHGSLWLNSNVPFLLLCKLNTFDRKGG